MTRTFTKKVAVKEEATEVVVNVKKAVTVTETPIEEQVNFKTGQKFPTPSPGNGGNYCCVLENFSIDDVIFAD